MAYQIVHLGGSRWLKMLFRTSLVFAVALLGILSCSKSSNPVTTPVYRPVFSVFHVGQSSQYQQWTLDSANGSKILSSLLYVHETIINTNFSANINGQLSLAYLAIDTTYDGTNTTPIHFDSILYTQIGQTIYYWGLIPHVVFSLFNYPNGTISLPYKWNKIIDQGNTAGWLTDTTTIALKYSGSTIYPIETLNGKDIGDTTFIINGVTYTADHAQHSGSLNANFASMPLSLDIYMMYSPVVAAKIVIAPSKLGATSYNGIERDLVKIN